MKNVEKMKEGMVFKNYKELCSFLEEPIKTGKSKIYQLEGFQRFFDYSKDGYKFVIKDIQKESEVKKTIKLKSSEQVELLKLIVLQKAMNDSSKLDYDGKIVVNEYRVNTLIDFGIIDSKYVYARNKYMQIERKAKQKSNKVGHFEKIRFDEERSINNKFERALKSLQSSMVLKYNLINQVFCTDNKTLERYVPNGDELDRLLKLNSKCEVNVLKEYNITSMKDFFNGNSDITYSEFRDLVTEEMNTCLIEEYSDLKSKPPYKVDYMAKTYNIYFQRSSISDNKYNELVDMVNNLYIYDDYIKKYRIEHMNNRIDCAKNRIKGKELKTMSKEDYVESIEMFLEDMFFGEFK